MSPGDSSEPDHRPGGPEEEDQAAPVFARAQGVAVAEGGETAFAIADPPPGLRRSGFG